MNAAPSPYHELACEIIARTSATRRTPVEQAREMELVFERLAAVMSAVVGEMGFRAVATRATHLARLTYPWIAARVSDGNASGDERLLVPGMLETIEREGIAVAEQASAAVLEHIINLLADFIGADLTLRLVSRANTVQPVTEPSRRSQGESGS